MSSSNNSDAASSNANNNNMSVSTDDASSGSAAQQQVAHTAPPIPRPASKTETPAQWLSRVRQVQLSHMTPEQRESLNRRANHSAQQFQQAKKMHSISHRNACAKTSTYCALEPAQVTRQHQSRALMGSTSTVPGVAGGTSAPPATHQQRAQVLMDQMEEDDELIAESFAAPQRADAPAVAMREEEQMNSTSVTRSRGMIQPQITLTEEQQALRGLEHEPSTDDARAAKFQVFETFSNKVMKIRADLDTLIAETVAELPPLPRQAVRETVKQLESDKCRGIYDQSRYWFVYDMLKTTSTNCDVMNKISEDVARRVRLAASIEQDECPVCLLKWTTTTTTTATSSSSSSSEEQPPLTEDDPPVVPVMLGCCHRVCETCWQQWTTLRGPNGTYCPICRSAQFVDDLQSAN